MANDPILSGYPDASTTGVPAGVTLTAYTGPMEITTPGTVIDGKVIRGTLRVMASDVTIKNSLIQNIGVWGIDGDGAARLTVQDSDIIGNGSDTNAGILGSGTFLRNDIQNSENGIVLLSGASTVRGNYIHDLQGGPGAHYDGISVQGGQNGVLIEHNTVLSRDTSDIFIKSDFGAINNVVVNDNYLAGSAGYVIYSMVGNSGAPVTNITITDNYVEKGFYGYYSIERGTAVVSGNIEFTQGSLPSIPVIPAGGSSPTTTPGLPTTSQGATAAPSLQVQSFGTGENAGSWSSADHYPRKLADVDGDGRADIVGFGEAGVYVALAKGAGGFAPAVLTMQTFGAGASAGSWTSDDRYPRHLADVNGDGRADIVAFGEAGVWVALANTSGGFGAAALKLGVFGAGVAAGGWTSDDRYPRHLADVNGDGRDDIVAFGESGVWVSLATGSGGFGPSTLKLASFGTSAAVGGWASNDVYPREVADVNGDGRADIVGFGASGVFVALANAAGGFNSPTLKLLSFGASAGAGSWSSQDGAPRHLADVNGDGRADIVGFGGEGVWMALGNASGGFDQIGMKLHALGSSASAGGWSSEEHYPRQVADVDGDGRADIVGFGEAGAAIYRSQHDFWI